MRNLSLLQDFLTNYFSYLSNICPRFPPLYFSGPGNGDVLSSMNLAGKVSWAVDSVRRPQEWLQVCNPTLRSHLGFDLLCLITLSASFLCLRREDVLRAFTWPAARNHILAIPKFRTSVLICLALSAAHLQPLRIYCLFLQWISLPKNREGNLAVLENTTLPAVLKTSWIKCNPAHVRASDQPGNHCEPLSPCNVDELRRFGKIQLFRSFATLINPKGNTRAAKVVLMGHSWIPAENSVSRNSTAELRNGTGGPMTCSEVLSCSQSNMCFLEAHAPRGGNHGCWRYPRQSSRCWFQPHCFKPTVFSGFTLKLVFLLLVWDHYSLMRARIDPCISRVPGGCSEQKVPESHLLFYSQGKNSGSGPQIELAQPQIAGFYSEITSPSHTSGCPSPLTAVPPVW